MSIVERKWGVGEGGRDKKEGRKGERGKENKRKKITLL